ncbi:MAG: hypothetical protein HRU09_17535 [Oligoflexales bacterium]|nr:hypothetical protein [Oligoflexales bacterium]
MTFKATILKTGTFSVFCIFCAISAYAEENFIEYWDRPHANYTDVVNPIGVTKKKISIKDSDLKAATIRDVQYKKKMRFKGV